MGFSDLEKCKQALVATNGDVTAAVERYADLERDTSTEDAGAGGRSDTVQTQTSPTNALHQVWILGSLAM